MPVNINVPGCFDDRYVAGKYLNLGTGHTFSDSDIYGGSVIVEHAIGSDTTLKSITAFRRIDSAFARDGDDSPFTVNEFADTLEQRQFTQEIQLLGRALDGRLDWILGGYYFSETGVNSNDLNFVVSRFRSGGAFENRSIAAFAQATFDLSDRFALTGGLRYTEDRKSFTPDQVILENKVPFLPPFDAPIFTPGTPVLPNVEATRTFDAITPTVNLAFRPNDQLLLYGSWSEGFKSGGFTQRVFPPIIPGVTTPILDPVKAIPSIDPEEVTAFEIGAKFTGQGGRLRFNAAAFQSDYRDLQIQVFSSVAPVFQNAASATIKGFEAEAQIDFGGGLFVEGSAGLTDAGYDEIDESETFVAPENELAFVSKWTLAGGIQQRFEIDANRSITPRIDVSYRSRYFTDAFNTDEIAQAGYALMDVNLAYRDDARSFSVVGSVENLFDKRYLISGVLSDAFQVFEGAFARGRVAKIAVRIDY